MLILAVGNQQVAGTFRVSIACSFVVLNIIVISGLTFLSRHSFHSPSHCGLFVQFFLNATRNMRKAVGFDRVPVESTILTSLYRSERL
jgi:hypothetical protein